ncbi:MAG TPA: hypothetical protein P5205_04170 [Candidatus Paceibacterota bacterium]|nr:hypothetical protein [Verrucomicrobiota bacterium]HSA09545.1 hypothetical protein [Candidatus Paceibacterota bacterium]
MKQYTATLKFEDFRSLKNLVQVFRDDHFVAERSIRAPNRQAAVRKTLQWFSTRFNGSVGPARQIVTVDDPYHEVTYDENFNCNDLRNKFLPEDVIERLLAQANGELERDTRAAQLGHPLCDVRRTKRRVKFKPTAIAPCIYQNACGTIFYRIIQQPQLSKAGRVVRKRKTQLVRLEAKTLPAAIEEIQARGLPGLHRSPRRIKKRSLALLQQIAEVPGDARPARLPAHNNGAALDNPLPRNGDRIGSRNNGRSIKLQDQRTTAFRQFRCRSQGLARQAP